MKNKPHPEDIIETALAYGIDASAERYSMTRNEVIEVVQPFTDEIDAGVYGYTNVEMARLCDCRMLEKYYHRIQMCWACFGPETKFRSKIYNKHEKDIQGFNWHRLRLCSAI